MNDPIKHVFDWIKKTPVNDAERDAKKWLDKFTHTAWEKYTTGIDTWLIQHKLTVEWRRKRYECMSASRLGDVWLKSNGSQSYYDHRVDVTELSKWRSSTFQ